MLFYKDIGVLFMNLPGNLEDAFKVRLMGKWYRVTMLLIATLRKPRSVKHQKINSLFAEGLVASRGDF